MAKVSRNNDIYSFYSRMRAGMTATRILPDSVIRLWKRADRSLLLRVNYFRVGVLGFAFAYGWSGYLPIGPDKVLRIFPEGILSYLPSVVALFSVFVAGILATRHGIDRKSAVNLRIRSALIALVLTAYGILIAQILQPAGHLAGDEQHFATMALRFPRFFQDVSYIQIFSQVSGAVFAQSVLLALILALAVGGVWVYRLRGTAAFIIGSGSLTLAGVIVTEIAGFARLGYLGFFQTFLSAVVAFTGVSDGGFRLTPYVLLFVGLLVIFHQLANSSRISINQLALVCLAWLSFPLVAHHLSIVEVASVSMIAALLIVPNLASRGGNHSVGVLVLLVLLTFMRLSVVLYLVLYVIVNIRSIFSDRKEWSAVAVSAVLLAPYGLGLVLAPPDFLPAAVSESEESRAILASVLPAIGLSVDWLGVGLLLIGATYWVVSRGLWGGLELGIFLSGSLALFFFSPPFYMVGFPKYQSEWMPLLVFLGLLAMLESFRNMGMLGRWGSLFLLIAASVWNLQTFANLDKRNGDVNARAVINAEVTYSTAYRGEHFILSNAVDQSQQLLRDWSSTIPRSECVIIGAFNPFAIQVLAGFTLDELARAKAVIEKHGEASGAGFAFSSEIFMYFRADPDVKCLVTSIDPDPNKSRAEAIDAGWLLGEVAYSRGSTSQVFLDPQALNQLP